MSILSLILVMKPQVVKLDDLLRVDAEIINVGACTLRKVHAEIRVETQLVFQRQHRLFRSDMILQPTCTFSLYSAIFFVSVLDAVDT